MKKNHIYMLLVIVVLVLVQMACGGVVSDGDKLIVKRSTCLDLPNTGAVCDKTLSEGETVIATGDSDSGTGLGGWQKAEVKTSDGDTGWLNTSDVEKP